MIQVSRKYENFADAYENSFELCSKLIYHLILPLLGLEPYGNLLDSCCGSGVGLEILSSSSNSPNFFGNDFSKSMIIRAKSKNIPNCEFIKANSTNLPYPCSFFSWYICNLSIHVISDFSKVISEAFRVLSSKGKAVFSYPIFKQDSDLLKILHKALRNVKIGPRKPNPDKYSKSLIEAGFSNIKFFETSIGIDLQSGEAAVHFIKDLKDVAKLKGNPKYDQVINFVKDRAQCLIDAGNCLTLSVRITMAEKNFS